MVQIKAITGCGETFVGDTLLYLDLSDNPEREWLEPCLKVKTKNGGYICLPLFKVEKLIIDNEVFINERHKKN